MKKVKTALIGAALFAGLFLIPKSGFCGISVYEIGLATGTNIQLISASSGVLYDVEIASGAAGDFVTCYDSATTTGISAITSDYATATRIADVLVSTTNTTTDLPAHTPVIPFSNGLVCGSSATRRVKIYYKTGIF